MEEKLSVYMGYAESNRYIPRMFMIVREECEVERHLNKMMDDKVFEIINNVSQNIEYDAQF